MTVATFTQPDNTAQVGAAYKNNLDGSTAALRQSIDGFLPHESSPAAMTVTVDSGKLVKADGDLVEVAQQTTPIITAPSADPRNDLVVIDTETGVVELVTGAEAGAPVDPDLPSGKWRVARVRLATATAAIDNSLIDNLYVSRGGAIGFSVSTLQDWVIAGGGSVALSALTPALTTKPQHVAGRLVFINAYLGYAVNDWLTWSDTGQRNVNDLGYGIQVGCDNSEIFWSIGAVNLNVVTKGGSSSQMNKVINDDNIKLQLVAWS